MQNLTLYRTVLLEKSEFVKKYKKKRKKRFSTNFNWKKRRVSKKLGFLKWKQDLWEIGNISFDAEFNALSNCAIRNERICQKVQKKKEKKDFPRILTERNEECRCKLGFLKWKQDLWEIGNISFDAEFNALSNCAIRKERICQKVQKKKKKKIFHEF